MEYKIKTKDTSCYGSEDGMIQIIVPKYKGKLFINWINPPTGCKILNNGKTIKNLPANKYLVELEDSDHSGPNKKSIYIDIKSPDELKLDFYRIQQPKCYEDKASIEIFFSGGTPPYYISYNRLFIQTHDNTCVFNHLDNMTNGYIKIRDKNKCEIIVDNIKIYCPKPEINLEIIEPSIFGASDGSVNLYLTNINNPKIGWYKLPDNNKPISTNKTSLTKQLGAGDYFVKIIDENDCEIRKYFTIYQPNPTTVEFTTQPDYSYGSDYAPALFKNVYNTILIPYNSNYTELLNIVPSEIVRVKDKKNIHKYKIIHQPDTITIDDIKYLAVYILPCFDPLIIKQSLTLIYKTKEYPLYAGFQNHYEHPHICMTFGILDNNYQYAFNVNDRCRITNNNSTIETSIQKIQNHYNLYDLYTNNTTIWFNNLSRKLLSQLNKSLETAIITCRSLDTKSIKKKGSIFISINGPYNKILGVYNNGLSYKYKLVCYNADKSYNNIVYVNDQCYIDGLDFGEYTIEIENYNIDFINNQRVKNNTFNFSIGSSQQKQMEPENTHKLLSFKHPPTNGTGLFLNIHPHNMNAKLYNDNYKLNLNSTYEVITGLDPGKYYLDINNKTKEIYIIKNQILTINDIN